MASNLSTIQPGETAGEQQEDRAGQGQRRRVPGAAILGLILANRKATIGAAILIFFILVGVFAPWIAPYDPDEFVARPHQAPSSEYWFGTTGSGEDVFSQTVWGTRISLGTGLLVGVAVTVIGALILTAIGNILNLTDIISNYLNGAVQGVIIVAAVYLQRGSFRTGRRAKKAE